MQLYTNHAFCCLGFTYYSYRQRYPVFVVVQHRWQQLLIVCPFIPVANAASLIELKRLIRTMSAVYCSTALLLALPFVPCSFQ